MCVPVAQPSTDTRLSRDGPAESHCSGDVVTVGSPIPDTQESVVWFDSCADLLRILLDRCGW